MKFTATHLDGVWIIEPERHSDARGYFSETFRADKFLRATGISPDFVQENESESRHGVLRGLHYQFGSAAQAKLVRVSEGRILDVAVDLRPGSPTFGQHIAIELSHDNGLQLYIPRGFAHGFAVLSPSARFIYKVDNYYCPAAERTVRYDDAQLAIAWPDFGRELTLSPKDLAGISLEEAREEIFNFQ